MTLSLEWEVRYGFPRLNVLGVDEVGRGCLAGPVVAAAVLLPENVLSYSWIGEVNDSKRLNHKKRVELSARLHEVAPAIGVGFASAEEIDAINILQASHLAMSRAITELEIRLGASWDWLLVDGNMIPKSWSKEWQSKSTAMVKGDSISLSIASASIVAKVFRDQWMERLDHEFPGYGFSIHKGYPTGKHLQAIDCLGISTIHRRSFGPVKERLL